MFCNQCEQTAKGTGCTTSGVCGKQPTTAYIQDITVYALRGLALAALAAREKGIVDEAADRLSVKALFATLTNVNFDDSALLPLLREVCAAKDRLISKAGLHASTGPLAFTVPTSGVFSSAGCCADLPEGTPESRSPDQFDANADIQSLKQILLYGLKGAAAYADHAAVLGKTDPNLYSALYTGLAAGFDEKERDLGQWVEAVLDCGRANLRAMELLDDGNTSTYGHPVPSEVALAPKPGKAILVTGHDLKDLYDLLVQTEGKGINIYTHGEMLPAHGYPGLNKFAHLAGHYGTAWQNQQKEFPTFPGAILFTTNCIQRPHDSYRNNVFTTGLVGWPDVAHVANGDFGSVITHALNMPGFTETDAADAAPTKVLTGFARNTVLGVADTVIGAVKSGDIKHFFLVGGCDGAKPGRNYYTEFVEKAPADTVILTLACGKFRFFDKDLGTIGGLPRLMDIGQCNDAYSAVQIALALANAFECDVNSLPLTLILSWYEQKAVAILLSLLALGIKNIHLGPTLPAFITPNILNFLVENFNIKPTTTAEDDLKAILS